MTILAIQERVARYFLLEVADLTGQRRSTTIVLARHIAMYLSREFCRLPFAEIGSAFGGRDHATVMHACKSVRNHIAQGGRGTAAVRELTKDIKTNQ